MTEKIPGAEEIQHLRHTYGITGDTPPHRQLKLLREALDWTQAYTAEQLAVDTGTVSRWETGSRKTPSRLQRKKLQEIFGIPVEAWRKGHGATHALDRWSPVQTREETAPQEQGYPPVWNVPFRIPLFVGREETLQQIYDALLAGKTLALTQAISGLGGIGKTFTAAQYAYEHRQHYQAVLWIDASSRESFLAGMLHIAQELDLPGKRLKDQQRVLEAVQQWMKEQANWLLIVDDLQEIQSLYEFLPTARRGHVLLTTRTQALGDYIDNVELSGLPPERGALLLLRKAGALLANASLETANQQDRESALRLSSLMDGLPLALDQAGAYIKEKHCGIATYLKLYEDRQMELLQWRNPASFVQAYSYPHTVATTWSLSFAEIERSSPAAVDLLSLSCFLHPDAIPDALVLNGASVLGPHLEGIEGAFAYETALAPLRRYSFIHYRSLLADKAGDVSSGSIVISIHRLVQAVFKDRMGASARREWARRAVLAVEKTFVTSQAASWEQFQQYLPHVQVCAQVVNAWDFRFPEAASLLLQAAEYTREMVNYSQSERYSLQAQAIYHSTVGTEHPFFANCLSARALLYLHQGFYAKAEPLFQRALDIVERTLPSNDPALAMLLTNLAQCDLMQGKQAEAEELCSRALSIVQQVRQRDDAGMEYVLSTLATLLRDQGDVERAEQLFRQALSLREQEQGPEGLAVAYCLNNLATVCRLLGQWREAEGLDLRALSIFQKEYGPNHPDAALCLTCLSDNAAMQGNWRQVEMLNKEALRIYRKTVGTDDHRLISPLASLALTYFCQHRIEEALDACQQAVALTEHHVHADAGELLLFYVALLEMQGQREEASEIRAKAARLQPGPTQRYSFSAISAALNLLESEEEWQRK